MTTKWFSSAQVLFQLRLQTNKPAKVKKPKLTGCKQTLNLSTVKDATWAHLIENAGLDVGVGEAREIDRVQRLKVVQRLQGRWKKLVSYKLPAAVDLCRIKQFAASCCEGATHIGKIFLSWTISQNIESTLRNWSLIDKKSRRPGLNILRN